MNNTRGAIPGTALLVALLWQTWGGNSRSADAAPAPPSPASLGVAAGSAESRGKRALLVGCTNYPNLSPDKQLEGPANDLLLMRQTLQERFAFPTAQIVVLSDADGQERGAEWYPTRSNIEREFRRLAEVARRGDQVVIFMAGHGSQEPERENTPDPEPDGLDEIFLPRDVGKWDGSTGSVINAIRDDDLGAWLKAIRAKEASVWVTIDACHSGTMIRGAGAEKLRQIDPERTLGIPRDAMLAAGRNAARTRGGGPAPDSGPHLARQAGIVALYAAQPNEPTLERPLPMRSDDAKPHGLLTYTLCQVLAEAAANNSRPVTYNELAQRIMAQYVQWGRTSPTPAIEGDDRDREVLGDKLWAGRSRITLAPGDRGLKLSAGALQGLTPESVLAVYPPPGQGETLLGHVRVRRVRTLESDVEPCEFAQAPEPASLPRGAVCTVVYADQGDLRLRLTVDAHDADGKPVAEDARQRLLKELRDLGGEGSLIEPVADVAQADWLLRFRNRQLVLVPAAGWSRDRDPASARLFGPVDDDARLGSWLREQMPRIARAENLKKLAAAAGGERLRGGGTGVQVSLEVRRAKDDRDSKGHIPVAWPTSDLAFYSNDLLVFRISNTGRVPADVTLLYVDADYGITCLFPRPGELNRLQPGEALSVPSPSEPPLRVTSETTGLEHLVLIAVRGQGGQADFSILAQPSLEQARTRGAAVDRGLATPLGQLLQTSLYAHGRTRGIERREVEEYGMQLFSWHIRPETRPAEK